jgi:hypothetical protein
VRALTILHDDLTQAMRFMHRARWNALWLAVLALLHGKQLWLTGLGRSRPNKAATKHSIKAIDRLLANVILYVERKLVCASLARHILRQRTSAVVLVDTTEVVTGIFALTAAIACNGRALPIYSRMVPSSKPDGRMLRRFLRDVASILPARCTPIFVTDAGFETPWFDAVAEMGWHYVGRLRNMTQFLVEGHWVSLAEIHRRATRRAKNLGRVLFPKSKPIARRVESALLRSTGNGSRRKEHQVSAAMTFVTAEVPTNRGCSRPRFRAGRRRSWPCSRCECRSKKRSATKRTTGGAGRFVTAGVAATHGSISSCSSPPLPTSYR